MCDSGGRQVVLNRRSFTCTVVANLTSDLLQADDKYVHLCTHKLSCGWWQITLELLILFCICVLSTAAGRSSGSYTVCATAISLFVGLCDTRQRAVLSDQNACQDAMLCSANRTHTSETFWASFKIDLIMYK